MERKPLRAMHCENCLLSLPSMQFHPRSLDFSGGNGSHCRECLKAHYNSRRPHGPDGLQHLHAIKSARLDKTMTFVEVRNQ